MSEETPKLIITIEGNVEGGNINVGGHQTIQYLSEDVQKALLEFIVRYNSTPQGNPTTAQTVPALASESSGHRIRTISKGTPAELRAKMIERVQQSWIEGFLYPALRDVSALKIDLVLKSDAVFRHKDLTGIELRDTGDVRRIFGALEERMLILGAPGAGKTILLLQLIEMLLKEAKANPAKNLPIPVVFNLASWSREQKPLYEWLVDEFDVLYRVRQNVAKRWLDNNDVMVMLDGLDEVKEDVRPKCVDAINLFREARPSLRIVVCSRIKDYETLPEKLNLKGALLVEALTQEQVEDYLKDNPALEGLRMVLVKDKTLREMSTTPFLLNTMIYTYGGKDAATIGQYSSAAERRKHLFEGYLEKRLQENPSPWSYADTLRYLKWLATKMQAYTQTVFRPEDIQPYWLDIKGQKLYRNIFFALTLFVASLIIGIVSFVAAHVAAIIISGSIFFPVFIGMYLILIIKYVNNISAEWKMESFIELTDDLFWKYLITYPPFKFLPSVLGVVPRNLPDFLHGMVNRHLMRSITGGHIFVHRYLMESLAGQDEIALLIERLKDKSIRGYPMASLVRIGEPALNLLNSALFSEYKLVRESVPQILGDIGEPAVETLFAALTSSDKEIRRLAVNALGKIGNAKAIEALIVALRDGEDSVRQAAIKNLAQISMPPVSLLIKCLTDRDSVVRFGASESLVQIGRPAVEQLISSLRHEYDDVRFRSAEALGKIRDARAVMPLIDALHDEDRSVRYMTAISLGKIRDARAVVPLIDALNDDDSFVRSYVSGALQAIGESDIKSLINILNDANRSVSMGVAQLLKKIGTPEALDAVQKWRASQAAQTADSNQSQTP